MGGRGPTERRIRITRYGRWAPPARPSACEGRHPAGVRFCFNVHDSGHARALAAIPRDELPRSRRVLHNAPPPARDTARGAPSGARGLAHRSQATRGPRHTHGQHLAYTSLPPPPAASSAAYRDPWLRPKWCRDRSPWLHSTNPGSADTSASRCIQRAVGHHSVPMHAAADIARASARAKRSCHANGRTLDGAAIESMRGIRRIRVVAAPPAQRGFDGPPRFECRPEAPPPELVENGSTSAEHLPRGDSKICSASCMTPSASVSCSTGSPDDGARP